MPLKSADEMLAQLRDFLPNVRQAVIQFEELERRFGEDADFRALWEQDSAAALRAVGINPDARIEMGLEPYDRQGPQCVTCITPMGNACHC